MFSSSHSRPSTRATANPWTPDWSSTTKASRSAGVSPAVRQASRLPPDTLETIPPFRISPYIVRWTSVQHWQKASPERSSQQYQRELPDEFAVSKPRVQDYLRDVSSRATSQ